MSGRRCRAIRAAFKRLTGRPPARTQYGETPTGRPQEFTVLERMLGATHYAPSEFRRLKKGYLRSRSGR